MDSNIAKKILALQAIGQLKKARMLNPQTARMILSSGPEELASKLQGLEAISGMFKGPFEKPDESVRGPIGLAVAENNEPIGMFPNECHVLISGMTGMGKTTLLRLIFSQALRHGQKVWLFARAGDLRCLRDIDPNILVHTFDGAIKINPLNPSGITVPDYCNIFLDLLVQSQRLYDGTKNYLLEHLNKLYQILAEHGKFPSLHDLYAYIKAQKHPGFSRTAAYRESALNRLGGLVSGTLGKTMACSQGHEDSLLEHNCIFEIDNLSSEQQIFISNLLLTKLFIHRLKNNNSDWIFVGMDDGNLLFDASLEKRADLGLPIIHHLLSTVRKSRINMFCCTQTPHQIGASIHSNSAIKIMFNLVNGQDVDFMHKSLGNLTPEQKEFCYGLGPGQIIVKNSFRFPAPVFGQVPELPEAKVVSDQEVQAHNETLLSRLPDIVPEYRPEEKAEPKAEEPKTTEAPKQEIHDNIKQFLMAVHLHQYRKTLTEISKESGLSTGTGSRIAKTCEKDGLIKIVALPFGRGKPKYPVLLQEAYEVLGLKENTFYGKGAGPEHILYQHLIAEKFSEFNPAIERNRKDKFIDVALEIDDRLIAIEVAMTPANEQANLEKDIDLAKADFVIVACKDAKVLEKVRAIIQKLPETYSKKSTAILIQEMLSKKFKISKFIDDIVNNNTLFQWVNY